MFDKTRSMFFASFLCITFVSMPDAVVDLEERNESFVYYRFNQ